VVVGLDAEGRLLAVSDTLNIEVTVPAALTSITVYPPVVYLQPCATASLEITGHYDDGVARDLSAQPGISMTFAAGNAAQEGASGIVLNSVLDDSVTLTFHGLHPPPVPIAPRAPDALAPCVAQTTPPPPPLPPATSPTVTAPPSTSTIQTSTTTSTTTLATTTTTAPETSTTVSTTTTPSSSTTTS